MWACLAPVCCDVFCICAELCLCARKGEKDPSLCCDIRFYHVSVGGQAGPVQAAVRQTERRETVEQRLISGFPLILEFQELEEEWGIQWDKQFNSLRKSGRICYISKQLLKRNILDRVFTTSMLLCVGLQIMKNGDNLGIELWLAKKYRYRLYDKEIRSTNQSMIRYRIILLHSSVTNVVSLHLLLT